MAVAATTTAQNTVEAARFGASSINGTARYRSMAGAFGALGGDPTCMTDNPAGLAIYRSSNLVTITPHYSNTGTETLGSETQKTGSNSFGVSNLAAIFSFKTPDSDNLVNFTMGIGFNRNHGLDAEYFSVLDDTRGSFGNYLTNQANDYLQGKVNADFAFDWGNSGTLAPFLSMMAYGNPKHGSQGHEYGCYAIIDNPDNPKEVIDPMGASPSYQRMTVKERSHNDEFNISGAWNINDLFFIGATMSISDFSSTIWTEFSEDYSYDYDKSYIYYDNTFESKGSGIGFNLGMMWMPIDSWRIGAAVHTPRWTTITENYVGSMVTDYENTDWCSFSDSWKYDISSPWEYQFSTAYIIGTRGLISLEYDARDFSTMRYAENQSFYVDKGYFNDANATIQDYLKVQHTLKVGGEYRIDKQWSVRAGYAFVSSPYTEASRKGYIIPESEVKWGNYRDDTDTNINNLVYYSSTKPNYHTLDNQYYVTCGAGWRGKQWYIDAAFMYHHSLYHAAAYPDDFSLCEPIDVNLNDKTFDLTLGYRF